MLLVCVLLVSFSFLSYEILLMRLLSITGWSHFAYMVISIALLGFGAGGTFLFLFPPRKRNFNRNFSLLSFGFALSLPFSFLFSELIPFEPFILVWYGKHFLFLLGRYLLLFLPFFLGSLVLLLPFLSFPEKIPRLYGFNLMGSGLGALGALLLLFLFFPLPALFLVGTIALGVPLLFSFRKLFFIFLLSFFFSSLFLSLLFFSPFRLKISQYKTLSLLLTFPEAEIVKEKSSPLGLITAVKSPSIRYAPGLSVNFRGEVPSQIVILVDGDSPSPVNHLGKNLSYLAYFPQSLPYKILSSPRVLIIGGGGGMGVLRALFLGAEKVEVIELNPQIVELVNEDLGEFSGRIYSHPRVKVHIAEGRGFVWKRGKKFDLIEISLLDSFAATSSGILSGQESYLYTREAIAQFLERLTPEGVLSLTRWAKRPPRDEIKLLATVIEVLRNKSRNPSRQIVLLRSWGTSTLLVKNSPFLPPEIEKIKKFCEEMAFDLSWYPGIKKGEVNRFHRLPQPYYWEAARTLFSNPERFYRNWLFFVRPAEDDRPYFFHFFRWKSLPYILKTFGKLWIPFIEWGYVVLILTLIQAGLVSFGLILLPLFFLPSRKKERRRFWVFLYFAFLGMGYMLLEIALFQKFILFLSHPLYAAGGVISSFLVFSGLGSILSSKVKRVWIPFLPIGFFILAYSLGLKNILYPFFSLSPFYKIFLILLSLFPLTFFMGMPYPLGLKSLSRSASSLLPWAWGVNGYFSVVGSILAVVLSIHFGFTKVMFLSGGFYLLAGLISRKL